VGVVSAKRLCAKRTGYEHLLITEGTNQKQVHHLKKKNNIYISNVRQGKNETEEKVFCWEMLSSENLHEPKNALGSNKKLFVVDNLKKINVP
jgi:hypothetical protein